LPQPLPPAPSHAAAARTVVTRVGGAGVIIGAVRLTPSTWKNRQEEEGREGGREA
jgi:hypothetical protein